MYLLCGASIWNRISRRACKHALYFLFIQAADNPELVHVKPWSEFSTLESGDQQNIYDKLLSHVRRLLIERNDVIQVNIRIQNCFRIKDLESNLCQSSLGPISLGLLLWIYKLWSEKELWRTQRWWECRGLPGLWQVLGWESGQCSYATASWRIVSMLNVEISKSTCVLYRLQIFINYLLYY
jgi:hypothetical protein